MAAWQNTGMTAARLVLFAGLATLAVTAQQRVTVLSYNIHHGEGMDERIDLPRIAGVIRSVSPDVVALQEVDRKTQRTGRIDQAEELSRLTGMAVVFGSAIDHEGGEYGNAVLSRLPILNWRNHPLPGTEPRAMLDITTPTFRFYATHLDAGRDQAERVAAARQIVELVARHKTPAVLAGDLNATPGSEPLEILETAWTVAGGNLPTFPVKEPTRQIDFVLFRPAGRWKVIEARVLDEAVASDHRPIVAILELLSE